MNTRFHICIEGLVQGIGFRPFLYQLANKLALSGWIKNTLAGVELEVQGSANNLSTFLLGITKDTPAGADIEKIHSTEIPTMPCSSLAIIESDVNTQHATYLMPDLGTCTNCLEELFDKNNHRYRYPFISCASCGPRFSIIKELPFDRSRTVMDDFKFCQKCKEEFQSISDRRFHAQTICCSECGPTLSFYDRSGQLLGNKEVALGEAIERIRQGKIIAVKGVGGFHIVCDARNKEAVDTIRQFKKRNKKPFAVMYPDLNDLLEDCEVTDIESNLLQSFAYPIVLVKKNKPNIASNVAPDNPYLGVMLPYTPLHHILLKTLSFPVVMTSANIANEPICKTDEEVNNKLKKLVDGILTHNRDIVRAVEDSVVQVIEDRPQVIRLGRGYAPAVIKLSDDYVSNNAANEYLATGSHQKNSIAFFKNNSAVLSQQIGDLDSFETNKNFEKVIDDYSNLFKLNFTDYSTDLHPDYRSSIYTQTKEKVNYVQHHLAHTLSLAAEQNVSPPFLSIVCDGNGLGLDETVWGGEVLHVTKQGWSRMSTIYPFSLLGGEKAIKEPRLVALSLLYEVYGDRFFDCCPHWLKKQFTDEEVGVFASLLSKNNQLPLTTSIGRLFEGVSSLLDIVHINTYEGEAATRLEYHGQMDGNQTTSDAFFYNLIQKKELLVFDWRNTVSDIIDNLPSYSINECFKNSLAKKFHFSVICALRDLVEKNNCKKVLLTGGCFQNRLLSGNLIAMLKEKNYEVFCHSLKVPPNDSGLALGQLMALLNNNYVC